MIKKKTALILLVVLALTGFGISSVYAKAFCHAGIVTQVGMNPAVVNETRSQYIVNVSCTSAVGDWDGELKFFLIPDLGDAGYATALTAISTGQTVDIRVSAARNNSLLNMIYINSAP